MNTAPIGGPTAVESLCLSLTALIAFAALVGWRVPRRHGNPAWSIGALLTVCFVIAAIALALAVEDGDPGAGPEADTRSRVAQSTGGLAAETSATGSFTNSIPIQVPAFHGIQPRVSLDYDSGTGNGEMGVGWRLTVGSTISRSGADGGLPRYDASDAFLLDGSELVACAPNCRTGGTHETYQQSFERFRFDGVRWTRWQRDGVELTYESTDTAPAQAFQWALARVTDTHGNTVTYEQDCSGHCYPDRITYAASTAACGGQGQPACKAGAVIRFIYEQRPDIAAYPTGRGTRQIRQRLRTIVVRMDGRLVAAYALRYAVSGLTGNSLLRSVQRFARDAAVSADGTVTAGATPPLPPTTFTTTSMSAAGAKWAVGAPVSEPFVVTSPPGTAEFSPVETSVPGNHGYCKDVCDEATLESPLYGDFNGDRRLDIASWQVGSGNCGPLQVRLGGLSEPTGPLAVTPLNRTQLDCHRIGHVTDLNGDGADDILLMTAFGSVARAVSHRDGTFTIDPQDDTTPWQIDPQFADPTRRCATADLNGDDLGDLLCLYEVRTSPSGGLSNRLGMMRSTPDGGWVRSDVQLPANVTTLEGVLLAVGDVDGSTTSDIMLAGWRDLARPIGEPVSGRVDLITGYTAPSGSIASWSTTPTEWSRVNDSDWSLSSADVDGDGRSDYILVQDTCCDGLGPTGDGAPVYIATSEKGARTSVVTKPVVATHGDHVAIGDVDGDGRDDILTGNPPGMLLSEGDGAFAARRSVPTASAQPRPCSTAFESLAAVDQQGDGQADLVCQSHGPDGHGGVRFNVWMQPSPVAPPPALRWRSFDKNGDGREDLYTVHYRNPGYEIYTLTAMPDGGYSASHEPITGQGGPLWPSEPDTSRWMPADVGGPGGVPDGRTDLVLVGRGPICPACPDTAETLSVTTLLSTAQGWEPRYAQPWRANGAAVPYDAVDTQTWRRAELNGDDMGDFVHFQPLATGVRVEYLLSKGDGGWTSDHSDHFTSGTPPGGALTRQDVGSFRVVDLNRDHLSDFVHVEVGGGPSSAYSTIRTLLSAGSAAWEEESERRFQPISSAAAHGLQVMDYEGDGVADLGRAVVETGCVRVEVYRRVGGGWAPLWTAGAPSPCQAAAGIDDRRNLVLADINQDGRTDVYHLSRLGTGPGATNAISTLVNAGDPAHPLSWRWVDQPGLPIPDPDAWAWMGLDSDRDGVGELAHIGLGLLRTLRWGGGDDRLTGIDNGRGARTTIAYRAQAGARSYLPAGMLPIVVDRITVTDLAHDPPVVAAATFTYGGARWSTPYRRVIGYATIRSEQGDTEVVTGNQLTDACGARISTTAIQRAVGGTIARTEVGFVPPGAVAPYTCLPASAQQASCELTTACLTRKTEYDYDAYGNLETVEESAGSMRRRTATPVRPNTADYIVDRPYKSEVLVPDPSSTGTATTWVPESRTLFGYDDDTWEHAPHQHGDLTRITAFSDIAADVASETFHDYDAAGNLVHTIDPAGVPATVEYDPDRRLYPVSVCNRVGCSTVVWDEVLGVARTVTNANEQKTTTSYDAYGRPVLTTRPDQGTISTRYLGTGVVTGPDGQRQRVRTETSDGSPGDGVHWHEELVDGLGRVYRALDEGPTPAANADIVSEVRYADASQRAAATATPRTTGEPPRWTTYAYDAAHRLTVLTHPGSSGKVTRTYRVGAVEDRDELDHLTTTHHDGFGRTVQVDEHVRLCSTCSLDTLATHYGYDASDRPISVTDAAGERTTIRRDDLGRETSITDPDRGTRTRTWRADGSLDTETDANGTHTWTYDSSGRPSTRVDAGPTGTSKARWDYDRDPATKQTQGFSLGLVTLITYSSSGANGSVAGTDRLWYDEAGRTTQARHCVDAVCRDMGYAFDPAGRLSDMRYPDPADPDGEHVKYSYDPAGRLTSVGGFLTGIQHDAAGQTISQTYGNGLIEQFSHDPDRLWLDTHTLASTPKPTKPIYAASYAHDDFGHITGLVTTNPTAGISQPVAETFTYDELGRLTTHRNSARPALLPETFEYDSLGRMTRSPAGGIHHYDDPAHLHASTSTSAGHKRTYDTAGNLKTLDDPNGRRLRLSWSPTGMPDAIADGTTATTMGYDADGQRVKHSRTGAGATYSFDRYLEQTPSGLTKYYWAGDQLIAVRGPTGAVSYLLQDHLHSTRVITDQSQAVTARYSFEPYGTERSDNQPDGTTHRWQGQRTEPDGGLVYMNARYYDPVLGQFTAPDSIVPDPYRPQSLNRYAFASGDPVNRWDPTGHADSPVEEEKNPEDEWAPYPDPRFHTVVHGTLSAPPLVEAGPEPDPLTPPPLVNADEAPLPAPPASPPDSAASAAGSAHAVGEGVRQGAAIVGPDRGRMAGNYNLWQTPAGYAEALAAPGFLEEHTLLGHQTRETIARWVTQGRYPPAVLDRPSLLSAEDFLATWYRTSRELAIRAALSETPVLGFGPTRAGTVKAMEVRMVHTFGLTPLVLRGISGGLVVWTGLQQTELTGNGLWVAAATTAGVAEVTGGIMVSAGFFGGSAVAVEIGVLTGGVGLVIGLGVLVTVELYNCLRFGGCEMPAGYDADIRHRNSGKLLPSRWQ